MALYEPISVAFLLITVLILAVSGELAEVFLTHHERDCYAANARLLEEQREGPLNRCH